MKRRNSLDEGWPNPNTRSSKVEVARDVSERYRQTEGWIEAMAEQGVEGLLLIGLWEKPKRPRHWRARRVTPKSLSFHGQGTGMSPAGGRHWRKLRPFRMALMTPAAAKTSLAAQS